MDIRTWLKKPNTTPAVSPQPGSSYRRTGEAEEYLPRPWQQVPRQMEESDSPAIPPVPTASDPGSAVFGAARPPSHSQQQLCLPEDLGVEKPVQGTPVPPKRLRQTTGALQDYVVSEGLGQREADIQQECKRLFFAIIVNPGLCLNPWISRSHHYQARCLNSANLPLRSDSLFVKNESCFQKVE
uniref:Uncharacterized protein n=1 Tax=Knipowitschia caucasica TaxID=637954 RepID=A0AAV2K4N6_KNICA